MRRRLILAFLSIVLCLGASVGATAAPAAADPPSSDQPCSFEEFPPTSPDGERYVCTVTTRIPLSNTFERTSDGCVSEDIAMEGEIVIVTHITVTDNGYTFIHHVEIHASGTGLVTGTQYTLGQESHITSAGHGAFEITNPWYLRLIGPGPDNNLHFSAKAHWTVNSQGESSFYWFDISCR